jgi:hypothetical protein
MLRAYPQTLDYAGKTWQGQAIKLIEKSVNYDHKSFIVQAPGQGKYDNIFPKF